MHMRREQHGQQEPQQVQRLRGACLVNVRNNKASVWEGVE